MRVLKCNINGVRKQKREERNSKNNKKSDQTRRVSVVRDERRYATKPHENMTRSDSRTTNKIEN